MPWVQMYVGGPAVIPGGRGVRGGDGVDGKCPEGDGDGVLGHIWRGEGRVEERWRRGRSRGTEIGGKGMA